MRGYERGGVSGGCVGSSGRTEGRTRQRLDSNAGQDCQMFIAAASACPPRLLFGYERSEQNYHNEKRLAQNKRLYIQP